MKQTEAESHTKPPAFLWHRIFTVITVLGAVGMVFLYLNFNGFWIDELYTLHTIRLGWTDMVMERLHRGHFPGYFALVRLWYGLWPEQHFETALRSMSVLFYLLAMASFVPLARKVLTPKTALIAVALFACNEIAVRQAVEARMYTLTLFIAVWIIRAWYELQQHDANRKWVWIMVTATVAGFSVSATTGVLVMSIIVVNFFSRKTNPRAFKVSVISFVCGLIVFIPGAIIHVETARRIGISASKPTVFLAHIVALMPGVQIWDDYYKTSWQLIVLLVIGFAVAIYAIYILIKYRKELSPELRRMAVASVLPLALITLSYPLVELFSLDIMGPPRYFLTLMPMAAMAGAWTIARHSSHSIAVHGMLTVFLLCSVWSILNVRSERFRNRIIEDFNPYYEPGDGLITVPHEIADGVELYSGKAKVNVALSRWILDHDKIQKEFEPLADRQNVWMIWYNGNDSPAIDVAKDMWGPFKVDRPDDPYGGIRIYEFHPVKQ